MNAGVGPYESAVKQYDDCVSKKLAASKCNALYSTAKSKLDSGQGKDDCKNEDCKIIASLAPKMYDTFDEETKQYFEKIKEYLIIKKTLKPCVRHAGRASTRAQYLP